MEEEVSPDDDQIFSFGYYILGFPCVRVVNYTDGKENNNQN